MINNVQNNDNSLLSQYLLAGIDFPLISRLDIGSLLALACNRKLYEAIQNHLLQARGESALKYQESRIIKSFFDLQTLSDDRDITPFQTLKQTTLSKSRIENWLGRKDLTTKMRFYGLLYSTRLQNYSLGLDEKDNQILEKLLGHLSKVSIEFEILLPYLLPYISEKTQGRWLDKLVTDPIPLNSIIKILSFFLTNTSLPSDLFFSLYEKIYENVLEGKRLGLGETPSYFFSFSKSLFSKLPLEKIQILFISSFRLLKNNSSHFKWYKS